VKKEERRAREAREGVTKSIGAPQSKNKKLSLSN